MSQRRHRMVSGSLYKENSAPFNVTNCVACRSLSSATLDHCAVDLWLEQGANILSQCKFHSNIPVAFCEVLIGSDVPLPWLHFALSLPKMQLSRSGMAEQINSPKLHCVRKTRQVCLLVLAEYTFILPIFNQFCPHNETVAVLQDLPLQYSSWLAGQEKQEEVLGRRVKREDVEGPGELQSGDGSCTKSVITQKAVHSMPPVSSLLFSPTLLLLEIHQRNQSDNITDKR